MSGFIQSKLNTEHSKFSPDKRDFKLSELTNVPITIIASKHEFPGYAKELRSSLLSAEQVFNEVKKVMDDE